MKKYFAKKYWAEIDTQQAIGNMLRFGVLLSATVASIGGIIYVLGHWAERVPEYKIYAGESELLRSVSGVLKGAFTLQSSSIMQLGVLLLIATPMCRVLFSFFAFLLEKDYLYVIITFIVFAIMLFSMIGGILS